MHILVCEAFSGPRPQGLEAAHDDGDPGNAAASNISWKTKKQNADDRKRHGTHPVGERNPRAKLTIQDVAEIRTLNATHREIASKFNVAESTISMIRTGRNWAA